MKLKIMTWNIKGQASLGWNNSYTIKNSVADKIIDQKADIIVLTEFVVAIGLEYLLQRFQEEGYIWFVSNQSGKNGILIAINKDMVEEEVYKFAKKAFCNNSRILSAYEGCNILRVELPLKCGINLCVMGCRMETGGKKSMRDQYDSEQVCFDTILMPMLCPVKTDHAYIVCGDFNNARCLGSLNEKYDPQDYTGKAQNNYNLNIIKDAFDRIGFEMADVGDEQKGIPTYPGGAGSFVPNDHIFLKGLKPKECGAIPSAGLSDHKIMWAMAEIDDEKS